MRIDLESAGLFVRPGATDMSKHINGLAGMAECTMGQNPFSGSLFPFSNRQKTVLKAVYWDRNGFCLWMKLLEKDRFPWPYDDSAAREISREEVSLLMRGIDFWHEHKELPYSSVL